MKEDTRELLIRSGKYAAFLLIVFAVIGFPYDASGLENMFFYMFGSSLLLILASGSLSLLFSEKPSSQYTGPVFGPINRGMQSPDMMSMDYAHRNNQAIKRRGNAEVTMPERLTALFLASALIMLISILGFAVTGA